MQRFLIAISLLSMLFPSTAKCQEDLAEQQKVVKTNIDSVNKDWPKMSEANQSSKWVFLTIAMIAGAIARNTMEDEYTTLGVVASVVGLVCLLAFLKACLDTSQRRSTSADIATGLPFKQAAINTNP